MTSDLDQIIEYLKAFIAKLSDEECRVLLEGMNVEDAALFIFVMSPERRALFCSII